MNKKFTAFFTGYGMTVNGNFAYGIVQGYETNATISSLDMAMPVRLHISFYATDDQKRAIEASIRNLALKYFNSSFSPYGLSLGFNDITNGRLLKRLPVVLDTIFKIISENGALNSEYCPVCGNHIDEANAKNCNIDGYTIRIDNDCVEKINSVISAENQDFANAPNNYLQGFFGALIGGLAGVLLAIGFYAIGFVSAISSIVSVLLGAFLYEKFHGKPNKMMLVIVSLTTLVLMAATVPAVYIVAAGIAAHSEGLSMSAIEAFNICMIDDEFRTSLYTDLGLTLLFAVIGIGLEVATLARRIKRKKSI
ncbi:MAG: hypothetical protein K2N84_06220 [Clostridia bacterium]|nr:hypothetical protein [Clostridia bacterium]